VRCVGHAIAGIVFWVTAHDAHAQPLDLDQPEAPRTGSATIVLIDRLNRDIAQLESGRSSPQSALSLQWRLLARTFIEHGQARMPRDSTLLLAGWTLADRARHVDSLWNDSPVPRPFLEATAHDLGQAANALPQDAAELDKRLRDALAMLVDRYVDEPAAPSGWVETMPAPLDGSRPDPRTLLMLLGQLEGLSDEAIERAERTLNAAQLGRDWLAFRRSAKQVSSSIAGAVRAIAADRAWMSESARQALTRSLDESLRGLREEETRSEAQRSLNTLASLGAMLDDAEALGPSPESRRLRETLSSTAPALAEDGSARLQTIARAIELAQPLPEPTVERSLVRSVRPGFRALRGEAMGTRDALLRSLPLLVARRRAAADPGFLAAIAAQRQALDDLDALARLSGFLAGEDGPAERDPRVAAQYQLLSDRLLKLTRRADEIETWRPILRELARQANHLHDVPGEQTLRRAAARAAAGGERDDGNGEASAPGGFLERATGFRQGDLINVLESARADWIRTWEDALADGRAAPPPATLEALTELTPLLHDLSSADDHLASLQSLDRATIPPLQAWPGWELSAEACDALMDGVEEELAEVSRLIVAGEPEEAVARAGRARERWAAAVLLGRLARETSDLRIGSQLPAAQSALTELGTGGPWLDNAARESWMAWARADLAELCVYAEEVAAAHALRESDRADALRDYVNGLALALLERWDTRDPSPFRQEPRP